MGGNRIGVCYRGWSDLFAEKKIVKLESIYYLERATQTAFLLGPEENNLKSSISDLKEESSLD